MKSTAVLEGDHYLINGTKIFITGADRADLVQLFARTGDAFHRGGGISCFLIDRDTPGMRIGQRFDMISSDRPAEIILRVPASQMLGGLGEGWQLARESLDMGRLLHGPKAIGRAERALALAVDFANGRETLEPPWQAAKPSNG